MDRRQGIGVAAWVGRLAAASAATVGAWWWSSTANLAGTGYCDVHPNVEGDGFGAEKLAPMILWPLTILATLAWVIGSLMMRPAPRIQRLTWAVVAALPVFVANREGPVWAAL